MTSPGFLFLVALMILFGVALVIAAALERRRAREIREGLRDVADKQRRRPGGRDPERPDTQRRPRS